jgi:hypothetical protein
MTYAVKRHLGYEPWGVTNPWVYANLAQPQRRRVPSKYVWQTHPPRQGMHPLGQIFSEASRGTRMEVYSLIGLTLTSLFVWRAFFRRPVARNKGRRRGR